MLAEKEHDGQVYSETETRLQYNFEIKTYSQPTEVSEMFPLQTLIAAFAIAAPGAPSPNEPQDKLAETGTQAQQAAMAEPDIEVTVLATRAERAVTDTPASVSRITRDELSLRGVTDFAEVVEREPLVSSSFDFSAADPTVPYNSGGNGSYTIRGVGGNRVQLRIDGVRQPLEVDFQVGGIAINSAGRDYFDPALYQSVEIFKGTASSLYGSDALAGVVGLSTPEPGDFLAYPDKQTFLGYQPQYHSASDLKTHVVTAAAGSENFEALIIFSRRDGEERDNKADTFDGFLPAANPVDLTSNSALVKGVHYAGLDHRFALTAELFDRDTLIDVNSVERDFETVGTDRPSFSAEDRIDAAVNDSNRERYRVSLEHLYTPLNPSDWFEEATTTLYYQQAATYDYYVEEGTLIERAPVDPQTDFITSSRTTITDTAYQEDTVGLTVEALRRFILGGIEHRLSYGLETSFSQTELPFTVTNTEVITSHFNPTPGDGVGDVTTEITEAPRLPPTDVVRFGLYGQDEFRFGERGQWLAIGGLRFDYYRLDPDNTEAFTASLNGDRAPEYEDISLSPSISLLYQKNEYMNFFASYRQGFRNPTPVELSGGFVHPPGANFRTTPNPNLEAEQSYAFEVGTKMRRAGWRLDAALFYTLYDNFIGPPEDTGEDRLEGGRTFDLFAPQNLESVEVYGYEVSAEAPLARIGQDGGLFYGLSFGQAFGENTETGEYLVTVDPFKAANYLEWRADRLVARLSGTYVDRKDKISDPQLIPTSAYFLLDLVCRYQVTDHLQIGGGLRNLTDQKYVRWQSVQNNIHGTAQDRRELFERATEPGVNGFIRASLQF